MKHGPNALIDENLPVVVLATRDPDSDESRTRYEKTPSNIQEVKARSGIVIAVACEPDQEDGANIADFLIPIPPTTELSLPILELVALHFRTYPISVSRGCGRQALPHPLRSYADPALHPDPSRNTRAGHLARRVPFRAPRAPARAKRRTALARRIVMRRAGRYIVRVLAAIGFLYVLVSA